MSDDWMRPITKPLPGPVASEGAQMTSAQRDAVVLQGAIAAHRAANHPGDIRDCARGCRIPVRSPRRSMSGTTWAERERGSLFDNAACAQCGRRVYLLRGDVKCDGCGESAPHGCMCPELPRVAA